VKHHLFRSSAGIDHFLVEDGGGYRFAATQDATPILERNRAEATHNDGYSADRTLRRAARIPYIVGLKWLNEEGWWFMDAGKDPDAARKLVAKLNSSEYAYLRTAEGNLGVSNGTIR
jgi:hypothetical protein